MERHAWSAKLVESLSLTLPPVAVAFRDQAPDGVANAERPVPSGCAFWRAGETSVFYATAHQHFNCPVGAMVMGFELPSQIQDELGIAVETMSEVGYFDPAEAATLPLVPSGRKGAVYGPLADISVDPDVVLMWLTPAQTMLFSEAAGTAAWTGDSFRSAAVRPAPRCRWRSTRRSPGYRWVVRECGSSHTFPVSFCSQSFRAPKSRSS